MADTLLGASVIAVVVGMFALIGFLAWRDYAVSVTCIERGGTYTSGMCLRAEPLDP